MSYSKNQWENAREALLNWKIEEFQARNKREPNQVEEYVIESEITEDELRDTLETMYES